ncbi:MAG: Methyltransferase domain-containing protein [Candidatus Kentron sp. G]|nr:MAG: Methyltransferase domain-containing protein [Candidatus Kentron sp. G]VFM99061.1 MAG: Methyltransferase domain-containing protein [Candidatus Kentron sp. G]VFM99461.1 MAG: Methyltransferase domain-containing protein [Candidatus Kentron sp. G]
MISFPPRRGEEAGNEKQTPTSPFGEPISEEPVWLPMKEREKYIQALIELHRGLERQGPGDPDFSEYIIERIPDPPPNPRIADIGCGAGAGTLFLAEKYHSKIKAVDFSREFLDQLMERARQKGLEDLVEPIMSDMGRLDWERGTIDLLWSEGAAYNITFEGALEAWRPLMAVDGTAVISEMNYFSDDVPEIVTRYMKNVYPGIKTEPENVDLINSSGFQVLGVHRLPSRAWWKNYYDPLRENIRASKNSGDNVMQAVISETEEEMRFFEEHEKDYGYTFYIIQRFG